MSQHLTITVVAQLSNLDRSIVKHIQAEIEDDIKAAALALPEVEDVRVTSTFSSREIAPHRVNN